MDCHDAVSISLSVLRHLLEKDCTTLLQLSYLIENIHDPILDSCQPSYRLNFPDATIPAAVAATLARRAAQQPTRAVKLTAPKGGSAAAGASTSNNNSNNNNNNANSAARVKRVTPPQPAVLPSSSTLFSARQTVPPVASARAASSSPAASRGEAGRGGGSAAAAAASSGTRGKSAGRKPSPHSKRSSSKTKSSSHKKSSGSGSGRSSSKTPAKGKGSSSSSAGATSSSSSKAATTTKGGAAAAAPAPSLLTAPEKPALPKVLLFGQYWELFANIATLYSAQARVVLELENAIKSLTALLEQQQQQLAEDAEAQHSYAYRNVASDNDATVAAGRSSGGGTSLAQRHGSFPTSPDPTPRRAASALPPMPAGAPGASATSPSPSPAPQSQPQHGRPHMQAQFAQLAAILEGFFSSDAMRRYTAEHMMFTAHYTQKIAPRVLELARLWRWGARDVRLPPSGASGSSSSSSGGVAFAAAVMGRLGAEGRQALRDYALLLDFLHRSFGPSGVPPDVRLSRTALPGSPAEMVEDSDAAAAAAAAALASVGGGGGSAGTSGVTAISATAAAAVGKAAAKSSSSSSSSAAAAAAAAAAGVRLPVMPADWRGFQTLLVLLATPLPSLHRYLHVARCLLETGVLLRADAERLRGGFVHAAAHNIREENDIVLEDVFIRDAENIMALINVDDYIAAQTKKSGAAGGGADGAVSEAVRLLRQPPTSDRVLLHYGRVSKRYKKGKHERLLFLFSDVVCYVEETHSGGGGGGRLALRGAVGLSHMRVIDVADAPALDVVNCFEIDAPEMKRLTLFVDTCEQKNQWVYALRYAARQRRAAAAAKGDGKTAAAPKVAPALKVAVLSPGSRLSRQRRADARCQEYVDNAIGAAASVLGGGVSLGLGSLVDAQSPIALGTPNSHDVSGGGVGGAGGQSHTSNNGSFANRSTGGGGGGSKHLEYDVTPWSRHSMHRRVRSQGSLASGGPTPPASPGASRTLRLAAGSATASPALSTINNNNRGKGGGGGGDGNTNSAFNRSRLGTPLRRPVSEWFDTLPPTTTTRASRGGSLRQPDVFADEMAAQPPPPLAHGGERGQGQGSRSSGSSSSSDDDEDEGGDGTRDGKPRGRHPGSRSGGPLDEHDNRNHHENNNDDDQHLGDSDDDRTDDDTDEEEGSRVGGLGGLSLDMDSSAARHSSRTITAFGRACAGPCGALDASFRGLDPVGCGGCGGNSGSLGGGAAASHSRRLRDPAAATAPAANSATAPRGADGSANTGTAAAGEGGAAQAVGGDGGRRPLHREMSMDVDVEEEQEESGKDNVDSDLDTEALEDEHRRLQEPQQQQQHGNHGGGGLRKHYDPMTMDAGSDDDAEAAAAAVMGGNANNNNYNRNLNRHDSSANDIDADGGVVSPRGGNGGAGSASEQQKEANALLGKLEQEINWSEDEN